jgi:hypothetical protein
MAERILRSPGVTTRELDLSAPGRVRPQGIPAGVIGTAQKGPAFVPVNFATLNDFTNLFGETEGKHFGAMAVREWMGNARSGIYLRVLGIGDGKKSDSDGIVTNSGLVVGENMRDKDRNTASGYATIENDGEGDTPVANPYAGASVESCLTSTNSTPNVAGNDDVVNTAVEESLTFTLTDPDVDDGRYILYEAKEATPLNTHRYWVFWLDAQINSSARTVSGDGTSVLDGSFSIWNTGMIDAATYGSHWVDPAQTKVVIINATSDGAVDSVADTAVASAALVATQIKNALTATTGPHPSGSNETYGLDVANGNANDGVSPIADDGAGELTITLANAIIVDTAVDPDLSGPGFVTTADAAGGIPSIMSFIDESNAAVAGKFSSVVLGELEVVLDTGTAAVWTLAFDANIPIPIGSTYILTGADGATKIGVEWTDGNGLSELADDNDPANGISYTEIDASGADYQSATWAQATAVSDFTTQITAAYDEGTFVSKANFFGGMTSVTFDGSSTTETTITMGRGTDPSASDTATAAALSENSPNAPAGRVFFLAAKSYAPTGADIGGVTHYNDYLGASSDVTTPNTPDGYSYLLRGVLMFPSGVMPGINESGTAFDENDLPSAAFGEYGTGKDLGATDYLGNVSSTGDFEIALNGFNNSAYDSILKASFDTKSPIYLSKVFNTDPTKIQEKGHYLYAHYDVPDTLAQWDSHANGAILKEGQRRYETGHGGSDYTPVFEDWRQRFSHAFSPWIMSQKLGNAPKKLFRFHSLDAGASGWNQFKISIANITKSTDLSSNYGSFDVQIRAASDTDLDPQVLQQFRMVNLNPASDRYIARVIGDQNTFFEFEKDLGKQKLVTEGLYPNSSQYIRVEVNDQVESGMMESTALPIGFAGKHHLVLDGKSIDSAGTLGIIEPPVPFRENVSIGADRTKVVDSRFYWGLQNQDISNKSLKNQSTSVVSLVSNLTKWYPSLGANKAWVGDNKGATDTDATLDADTYNNNYFSLERLWIKCVAANVNNAVDPTQWHEAVYIRDGNTSGEVYDSSSVNWEDADGTAKTAGYRYLDVSKDFGSQASKKFYKFTLPMQGGWNGLDLFDQDKSEMASLSSFREMDIGSSSNPGPDGPTTAAFRKALDILAEKSDVDIQLLATPGMRTAGITDYAIDKTEDRFDALYIMDMSAYDHDNKLITQSSQETSVANTAQTLADRNLDTSFAATYFPDLVMRDGSSNVVAPPSVAVLGALSLNDKVAHPWYAPAGFARGALASTIETSVKLNRTNMDVLYESDINPITAFPQTGESVIVFGQKTMLQAQSALDRVNVRRLLIDVRRKVRTVANQILFEPNREATLARFSSLVNPILGRIQQQQGLDRFKVVIDTTTTTQQDVENNTIRGKIFLQPTRSIEFISLDFVVTNAGAEI